MRRNSNFIFLGLALLILTTTVSSYKYLAVLHFAAKSHHIIGSSLMKGLARAGHEVTVLSAYPLKEPLKNYHDINTPSVLRIMNDEKTKLLDTLNRSVLENVIIFHQMGVEITKAFLNEPSVQELMKSNQTFDAVICEVFLSEALFGFSELFNAPLIGIGTFGAISWNTDLVGTPSPPSYVPNVFLPLMDHMTLPQRIGNFAYQIFERLLLDLYYLPKQEALYKEYFPNAKRTMSEVSKNTALVLLNTHVSLTFPRPYVPNMIEVGGLQINHNRKPLPANIEKFISESEHGVIYFSMGSNLKSKDLPLEKRQILLETFKEIKQRILWKFEDPKLEGKPDNVLISDWFPQDDILAHPKVKVFITHGGLLSTTESIYHGKPIIGIPIFADQFINMAKAENMGYGITIDYFNLNKAAFKNAIQRMINEPSYAKNVKEISERFRDQPTQPLDRAIYWVEHIVRHKGAKYLHCAGQDLNFIQYHNIDVILIFMSILIVLLLVVRFIVKLILRGIFGKHPATSKKQKQH